ncbi:MAG: EamA family transporter RarD [Actinomycetota bacterium]|nr:EamA family transporter RarD [Actinomycetota bacterium]
MSEQRRGFLFGVAAYLLWGLFPLYWPLLEPAGAVEILAHRVLWSLVVVVALLALARNWSWLRTLGGRRLRLLTVAALVIAVNWGMYIWGVNTGHVVETSLGYFINPLVTVLLGVVVLGERLRPAQWVAVALATVAVAVLTVAYGRPPWLALTLATSFGTYGLLKKQAGVGAVESLTLETGILAVPALAYVLFLHAAGDGSFGTARPLHAVLLAASGLVTAIPLLCFGAAAIRVPLTTLGLLQYLAPVVQFVLGVLYFHEDMPAARVAGFALVWLALAILTVDGVQNHRRSLRRSAHAAAV